MICTVIWAARRARQGASHFAITAKSQPKSQPNPNDLLGAKRLVGAVIWAVIWSVICAVISDGSGAVICTVIWAARRARLPFHRQITAQSERPPG